MTDATRRSMTATPLQMAATVVAATFLLVGILGFVPGITQDYGQMEFAGHESRAELLGLFQISVLHNIVHLAFGVIGLVMASTALRVRNLLIGGGIIYLVLWVYGLVVGARDDVNFVPMNTADDWLHFGLGIGMILLGVILAGRGRPRTAP